MKQTWKKVEENADTKFTTLNTHSWKPTPSAPTRGLRVSFDYGIRPRWSVLLFPRAYEALLGVQAPQGLFTMPRRASCIGEAQYRYAGHAFADWFLEIVQR